VHRQHQAKERRNQHPESSLWESEVGSDWLRQMVIATLFHFGLGSGCGGDCLSQFFKMICIDTHKSFASNFNRFLCQLVFGGFGF